LFLFLPLYNLVACALLRVITTGKGGQRRSWVSTLGKIRGRWKPNSKEEFTEGRSAYSDAVMIRGQQPALKRTMRTQVGAIIYCRSKIGFKAIGCIRMRLNYQNSSNFGTDFAYLWLLLLHRYSSHLRVNFYFKGNSKTGTLLIAFRTGYKRVSLNTKLRVTCATGEVSNPCNWSLSSVKHSNSLTLLLNKSKAKEQGLLPRDRLKTKGNGDGRGSVVPPHHVGKGPKHLVWTPNKANQIRSYATRSGTTNLAPVKEQLEYPKGLRILAKHWLTCYHTPDRIFYDLRGILKQESIWFAAYLRLKTNKGFETPGPLYFLAKVKQGNGEIIDALTQKRILELREAVLKNKFTWKGVRQMMIPKPGKPGKLRPLGIPSINDRIVQEVIQTIIEPIYELNFSNLSHGFRPRRSCHTALKWINTNMKDSIWYIEGDIQNYFPSINHKILMKLIERRVKDPTILRLIRTGLKAKVFLEDRTTFTPEIGTPQGGILSPLLSNIYLNELDRFMEKLSEQYQGSVKASNRKKNPVPLKLLRSGNKSMYHRMRIPSRDPYEVEYRNCKYIRYADDFIIGVLGPRELAVEIREKVKNFLTEELRVKLNLEKTKITHITKGIEFLGHIFSRYPHWTLI
jgi:group II intron reverse transcriptase/maturase